ncbi:uncharacterized protein EV422DRAFT_568866 [Fimicolochytrium jonesii]|uniref:uncharacterized protein n=1 Tax=Fimicolochytrium jonesii TaxID=1396493 RepID=UPI0022FDE7C8|nr:uncharacterized protein EV422DRAFT_568866 [Fimicolochytrium jonesii]KAI8819442.1 hypothetical protein EV422DRAFT_568866 [Fimicolochytrium jonesii]
MTSRLGGMVASGKAGLRPELPFDDEFYGLKNENLDLKRKVNDQDEKTKQLITKVQKLTDDLRRAKENSLAPAPASIATVQRGVMNRREAAEMEDLVDDLRTQMRNVAKENSQLKNKMNFFKALHEAETRKGARYDHIPPRTNSGLRKLYPALAVRGRGRGRAAPAHPDASGDGASTPRNEEVEKLEEIVTMLRAKLMDAERDLAQSNDENGRLRAEADSNNQESTLTLLSTQRTLSDLQARYDALRDTSTSTDAKLRAMTEKYGEVLSAMEALNKELRAERDKRAEAEERCRALEGGERREGELKIIIEDLRAEKRLLEEEQKRLLASQFNTQRMDEYAAEAAKLRSRVDELSAQLADALRDQAKGQAIVAELREQNKTSQEAKQKAEASLSNLQAELDELKKQLRGLYPSSKPDWNELRDALEYYRSKGGVREAPRPVDDDERQLLKELRLQFTRATADLEKTRKLLQLQEGINRDYKDEVAVLGRRVEAVRNEYETRLEEDARLLELRANRIAVLEAQLRNAASVDVKGKPDLSLTDDDDVQLEKGQNLLSIHLHSARLTPEGVTFLQRLHNTNEPRSHGTFATFCYFDFFDFETAVTGLAVGEKMGWNFTAKYKLFIDDFCLMYLQMQPVTVYLCRADGLDFVEVAECVVRFKDLTDPSKADKLQYYGDLVSSHDHKTIIGRLNYTLSVKLPMAQTIRAFKERSGALGLLADADADVAATTKHGKVNELVLKIDKCEGLDIDRARRQDGKAGEPAVYLAFQLPGHDHVVTSTVRGTANPEFNLLRTFRMVMTAELDRKLRTGDLRIMVLEDSDNDFIYGTCAIPLLSLALGDSITGAFDIFGSDNAPAGKLTLSLSWEQPYRVQSAAVVPHLDWKEMSVKRMQPQQRPPRDPSAPVPPPFGRTTRTRRRLPLGKPKPEPGEHLTEATSRSALASPGQATPATGSRRTSVGGVSVGEGGVDGDVQGEPVRKVTNARDEFSDRHTAHTPSAAHHHHDQEQQEEEEGLTLTVDALHLSLPPDQLPSAVFIALEEFPLDVAEGGESPVCDVEESGDVAVGWRQFFPLDSTTHRRERFRLRRALLSPDDADARCSLAILCPASHAEDRLIGYASFDLQEWIEDTQGDVIEVPIVAGEAGEEGEEVGSVVVVVRGRGCVRGVIEE